MNIIDIIILVCFVPAIVQGISKGFITQAISLVSIILGVWLAFHFSKPAGDFLEGFIDLSGPWLHAVSFALILLVVVLVLNLIGKGLGKVVKLAMLGWMDKLLGIVLAVVKVFLLIGLVVILFDALNSKFGFVPQQTVDGSVLYKPLKDAVDVVFPYLKGIIFNK